MTMLFALPASLSSPFTAHASESTQCYRFLNQDTPIANDKNTSREEIWCYRQLTEPRGSHLVFHLDEDGRTQPELSILVESDGTITHASLLNGNRTVHRILSQWSPLGVPLTPPGPDVADRIATPISIAAVASSDRIIELFSKNNSNLETLQIAPGEVTVSVAEESLPWRGYWFPHSSGRLHRGANSPMAKFDAFVKSRTGKSPGAQAWERSRHRYTGLNWAGHCNGWAAASILRKEPREPVNDLFSGVTFNVADLKGLWMERDYCPKYAFFGRRYYGPGSNRADIRALDFHNTITHYIGNLKKPILMDYMSHEPVENRVVSGYTMKTTQLSRNTYRIEATLTVHEYDSKMTNDTGVAPTIRRSYRYRVTTDESGQAIKASWLSSNPDFFWVPLHPASCKDGNPAITEHWMNQIGKSTQLPKW